MQAKLLFIHALSPLHAGTGQGVGVIDQPIAREKVTNIPYLPGSSLKGVLRAACADTEADCDAIFGPDTDNADAFAGSVNLSDARLLLLPVRSIAGVFAWVTCPYLFQRLKRDMGDVFEDAPDLIIPTISDDDSCLVSLQDSDLVLSKKAGVILEDLPLTPMASDSLKGWGDWLAPYLFPGDDEGQAGLISRLCLVSDDVFSFLLEIGTQITARIRIQDETKTVARGALWYEEALPAETILSSLVVASNVRATPEDVFKSIMQVTERSLQFGGSATVGQGLCRTILVA